MKKIFVFLTMALAAFCISCDNNGIATTAEHDTAKDKELKNVSAFDEITEAFQTGNAARIDSVVAKDYVDHIAKGDIQGRDSLKALIRLRHYNYSDMKTEMHNTAASGDYVYGWITYSGTSDGSMGIPAGPFNMNTVELERFQDGKAVEHWSFTDVRDIAKMMPPPPPPPAAIDSVDTTKIKKIKR